MDMAKILYFEYVTVWKLFTYTGLELSGSDHNRILIYEIWKKKKDESLSGTEVPREPNIIRMVFYGTCMVFMMLQAVIYVIVYKFSQMPIWWICENFIFWTEYSTDS